MNSVTSRWLLADSEQKTSSIRQPALQQPFCYLLAFVLMKLFLIERRVFRSVCKPQSFIRVCSRVVDIVRPYKCLSAFVWHINVLCIFRRPTAITMLKFYSYRVNLLIRNTLFSSPEEPKEKIFQQVINDLQQKTKDVFMYRNSRFILYFYKELMSNVYVLELAKEEILKIGIEGDTKIEERPVKNAPFVYVIIDSKRQIVLIQEKATAFPDIEVAAARLLYYFENKLMLHFITPALQPITDNAEFWDEVRKADGITEFDITLEAPNLFKGRQKAEDLVEEIHDEFNITEFEIKLKNKLGQLKLLYENAKDFVSLAASGAGKYILRGFKDGKNFVLKSFQFIKKKTYDANVPEEINQEELSKDLDELDKLNENTK